jgi:ATP-binding protein involved in chromosome partitioning
MPTREQITDALRRVIDPELRKDIVSLGMVRSIEQPQEGRVDVMVSLTTPGCPIRSHFQQAVSQNVGQLDGVRQVGVEFDVLSAQEKQSLQQRLGRGALPQGALAAVKNVVCVGSGKGGVGKSTVTANLAAALQAEGKAAAALDADVWGYSIPLMLGVHGRPSVTAQKKIVPLEARGGVRVISIEFFLSERDQAITWRGPMLHKAIRQFLEDVDWGELDYLLIDLPPGTGDVSMTLAQLLPQARFVIVTTPQPAAQKVARRAAETAQRFDLEIAGVVENMSGFTTPDGQRFTIFGEGGGQLLADDLDVPLLGKIPLQEELRVCADEGRPLVLEDPDAPAAQALFHTARGVIAATPQDLAVMQAPSGPPVPEVTGRALPMAPVAGGSPERTPSPAP